MEVILLGLLAVLLAGLLLEQRQALRDRARLEHIVHVNGIRGKSTVTRLIDAGLRAGGLRVFCKTTGTVPMTIGTCGTERPLLRRGRANIKEQLSVLRRAAAEDAQILVVECMAVDPALQAVAQHKMLRADVGVITNVRLDHTAEMGGPFPKSVIRSPTPSPGRVCSLPQIPTFLSSLPEMGRHWDAGLIWRFRMGRNRNWILLKMWHWRCQSADIWAWTGKPHCPVWQITVPILTPCLYTGCPGAGFLSTACPLTIPSPQKRYFEIW